MIKATANNVIIEMFLEDKESGILIQPKGSLRPVTLLARVVSVGSDVKDVKANDLILTALAHGDSYLSHDGKKYKVITENLVRIVLDDTSIDDAKNWKNI